MLTLLPPSLNVNIVNLELEAGMASTIENAIRSTVMKGIEVVADFNRQRMPHNVEHPFLTGIHTPMTEELTLEDLPVTGTIPAALDGRYLRIGPNPVAPDPAGYHWFTGDGMVHGVAVKDGRALWSQPLDPLERSRQGTRRGPCPRPAPWQLRHRQHQCHWVGRPHLRSGRGGQLPGRTLRHARRADL
jgi:hypothetical protein